MGSACCVAARDKSHKTIQSGQSSDVCHRSLRCSPTWSFRWENRGRVAGEETSLGWLSDGVTRNDGSEIKYGSAYASEEGSPLEIPERRTWKNSISEEGSPFKNPPGRPWQRSISQEGSPLENRGHPRFKCPTSEVFTGHLRTPASGHSHLRNTCIDTSVEQLNLSTESVEAGYPSPAKLSTSLPYASSLSASPLSFQSQQYPGSSTPLRGLRGSPGHQLLPQFSDIRIPGSKSPNSFSPSEDKLTYPSWSNDTTRGFRGESSDGWSMHAFSELMATSRRDRWSFDSESFGFIRDKITRSSSRISDSSSAELQTCGVCSKLLTEKSLCCSQRFTGTNELSVVAVLVCGHVYHAECLESMTSEINKYDPACPLCTFGEKQTHKLCDKMLKGEMNMKMKDKRATSGKLHRASNLFERIKGSINGGRNPRISSSSSMKVSQEKPFLKRHFSFRSKGSRSLSETRSTRKMGFFWANSIKE